MLTATSLLSRGCTKYTKSLLSLCTPLPVLRRTFLAMFLRSGFWFVTRQTFDFSLRRSEFLCISEGMCNLWLEMQKSGRLGAHVARGDDSSRSNTLSDCAGSRSGANALWRWLPRQLASIIERQNFLRVPSRQLFLFWRNLSLRFPEAGSKAKGPEESNNSGE
jgi:hypothetical protein